MRLSIRFLGLDLFDLDLSTDSSSPEPDDKGEATAFPVGFTPSHGDQRWEKGSEV